MQQWEREWHVARILAGKTRVRIEGRVYYITTPTPDQRLISLEVYQDALKAAALEGALSEADLLSILLERGIWTEQLADEYQKYEKALEDLKVILYEKRLIGSARLQTRSAIRVTKEEIKRLDRLRHCMDHVTIDGFAAASKYYFLLQECLHNEDGSPCCDETILESISDAVYQQRLTEADLREISRTEPWRSLWSSRNSAGRGLFDFPASFLSDEQKNLIAWSNLYDSIRDNPNPPEAIVFEDDDMLDGWMLVQKRQRDAQVGARIADSIGNKNADETYVFVNSLEDAREIDKLNDPIASNIKNQRMAYLKQNKEVSEVNMPDTANKIRMELNRLESFKMRQG